MIRLIVLGSAQDAGVPQLGCNCERCGRARRDPRFVRNVASLGIVDSVAARLFLIDATPDIRSQLDFLSLNSGQPRSAGRNMIDGVILTHAHIGHYTGLIQFEKEVMATNQLPTYCSESMADFLRGNGPWSKLVLDGHIGLVPFPRIDSTYQTISLTEHVSIRPFLVPHRQEWSDTLGIEIIGPHRRLLYIPDVDSWSDWVCDIRSAVSQCDLALLDGTFLSGDELPGGDMNSVPHPLITDSMELLKGLSGVHFTHFNHTNPALDPDSQECKEIQTRGFHVAQDKMEFEL